MFTVVWLRVAAALPWWKFPHVGGGGRLWRPPTWHVVVRARTCRRRLDTSLGAGATRQDPAILLPDWRLAVVRWLRCGQECSTVRYTTLLAVADRIHDRIGARSARARRSATEAALLHCDQPLTTTADDAHTGGTPNIVAASFHPGTAHQAHSREQAAHRLPPRR